jgi:hypothetical protein
VQIPTRSRGPVPGTGAGAAPSARPPGLADRLATLRASQAALSAETRLRRLLLALVVPELVVALVLLLAGSYLGVVIVVLAAAVQVAAALLLVPGDADGGTVARPVTGSLDPVVLAGQGEEIASLRAQLASADAGLALQNELARRHRELLLRQLARIDALEADEADPAALGELFALDHLATRMRRYSEGALLIAGSSGSGAPDAAPVPASEVLRGAVAEIEDFHRVDVSVDRDVLLAGGAAVDLVHLLAELIENATVFSSPTTRVKVHGQAGEAGYVVTIADEGVGMTPERAVQLHTLLAADSPGLTPGHLGYQLVARLARRQGLVIEVIEVVAGTGAEVRVALPPALVVGAAELPAAPGRPSTLVPPPPGVEPVAWTAAVVGAVPALTIPEAGEGLPAAYPVLPDVDVAPEPVAAADLEPPAYAPPEAGFTGVSHAPDADWPDLPLPIEFDEGPAVLPSDLGVVDEEPQFAALYAVDDPAPPDPAPVVEVLEPASTYEPDLAWRAPLPPPPPMPAEPDRAEPAPFVPPAVLVPAQGPREDEQLTDAGLARRTPQAHMAPQILEEALEPLPEDVVGVPAPDRSRSLLSAYRDGLVLGRGGLTPDDVRHHLDDRQQFDVPFDETGESR